MGCNQSLAASPGQPLVNNYEKSEASASGILGNSQLLRNEPINENRILNNSSVHIHEGLKKTTMVRLRSASVELEKESPHGMKRELSMKQGEAPLEHRLQQLSLLEDSRHQNENSPSANKEGKKASVRFSPRTLAKIELMKRAKSSNSRSNYSNTVKTTATEQKANNKDQLLSKKTTETSSFRIQSKIVQSRKVSPTTLNNFITSKKQKPYLQSDHPHDNISYGSSLNYPNLSRMPEDIASSGNQGRDNSLHRRDRTLTFQRMDDSRGVDYESRNRLAEITFQDKLGLSSKDRPAIYGENVLTPSVKDLGYQVPRQENASNAGSPEIRQPVVKDVPIFFNATQKNFKPAHDCNTLMAGLESHSTQNSFATGIRDRLFSDHYKALDCQHMPNTYQTLSHSEAGYETSSKPQPRSPYAILNAKNKKMFGLPDHLSKADSGLKAQAISEHTSQTETNKICLEAKCDSPILTKKLMQTSNSSLLKSKGKQFLMLGLPDLNSPEIKRRKRSFNMKEDLFTRLNSNRLNLSSAEHSGQS